LRCTARKKIGAEETNQVYLHLAMGLRLPFLNLLNEENNRETRTSGGLAAAEEVDVEEVEQLDYQPPDRQALLSLRSRWDTKDAAFVGDVPSYARYARQIFPSLIASRTGLSSLDPVLVAHADMLFFGDLYQGKDASQVFDANKLSLKLI